MIYCYGEANGDKMKTLELYQSKFKDYFLDSRKLNGILEKVVDQKDLTYTKRFMEIITNFDKEVLQCYISKTGNITYNDIIDLISHFENNENWLFLKAYFKNDEKFQKIVILVDLLTNDMVSMAKYSYIKRRLIDRMTYLESLKQTFNLFKYKRICERLVSFKFDRSITFYNEIRQLIQELKKIESDLLCFGDI